MEERSIQSNEDTVFQLTAADIIKHRKDLSGIIITPFSEEKAKGIGYNISSSELVYSITRNKMVTVRCNSSETYIYLKPHETILTLSYEYIKVPDNIVGTFHSRVRMNAIGIGSTSTTLDPDWNGMLLLSLNNPTKKKIKVVLATRRNGKNIPSSMITMVVECTKSKGKEKKESDINFRLDNPAMRMDIWSELVATPYHLFANKNYQKFKGIIDDIANFQSSDTIFTKKLKRIQDLLLDLKIALIAEKSNENIKKVLLELEQEQEVVPELKDRIIKLMSVMNIERENLVSTCNQAECRKLIALAEKEVQFQILTEQVQQIHEHISKNVPRSWEHTRFENMWHKWIRPYSLGYFSTIVIFIVLFLGGNLDEYLQKAVVTLVPMFTSLVLGVIKSFMDS